MPLQQKNTPPYYQITETTKIWKAKISQTGTGQPEIITIFINTLQTTPVTIERDDVGHYDVTLQEDLPANKWEIQIGPLQNDINIMGYQQIDTNAIQLRQAVAATGAGADTFTTTLTIIIYP